MLEQVIERSIAAIIIDFGFRNIEQIIKCRASIPILGNMQFAGRFAQASDHQYGRHLVPANVLASRWHQTFTELIQTDGLPQSPRQPDITESTSAFQSNFAKIERTVRCPPFVPPRPVPPSDLARPIRQVGQPSLAEPYDPPAPSGPAASRSASCHFW